jgi:hypothetical protein
MTLEKTRLYFVRAPVDLTHRDIYERMVHIWGAATPGWHDDGNINNGRHSLIVEKMLGRDHVPMFLGL